MTAGSKSSATRWPRSTHNSNPTSLPIVADQYQPGKFRYPLYDGNDRTGWQDSRSARRSRSSPARTSRPPGISHLEAGRQPCLRQPGLPGGIPSRGQQVSDAHRSAQPLPRARAALLAARKVTTSLPGRNRARHLHSPDQMRKQPARARSTEKHPRSRPSRTPRRPPGRQAANEAAARRCRTRPALPHLAPRVLKAWRPRS